MEAKPLHIDKFKQPDGWYRWTDGAHYETAENLLQTGVLEMCGCGSPETNLRYVRDGLANIEALRDVWDKKMTYPQWEAEGVRIFGNTAARDFFFYWADTMDFTEHGGSIPGWLTQKGRELLEDLRIVCAQFSDE